MTTALLSLVVFGAFAVESALGFGATVVAVTLGIFLCPLDELLPAFVPLNMVLSGYLVVRYRRDVSWRLLLTRVLPLMALGLPLGMVLFRAGGERLLRGVFGVFVVVLSALELLQARVGAGGGRRRLPLAVQAGLLVVGGVLHGAFATGGPMAVYVAGRELTDKAPFRASLATLWLLLNAVLVTGFLASGALDGERARLGLLLAAPLLAGLVAGEWIHARVNGALFRTLVFTLLLVAGAVLVVGG